MEKGKLSTTRLIQDMIKDKNKRATVVDEQKSSAPNDSERKNNFTDEEIAEMRRHADNMMRLVVATQVPVNDLILIRIPATCLFNPALPSPNRMLPSPKK